MMHSSTTVMTVRDIPQSLAYYRDKRLGFETAFEYGKPTYVTQACAAAACACTWSWPTARRGSPATAPRLSPSTALTGPQR